MNRSLLPLPSNVRSGGLSSLCLQVSYQENRWSWFPHRTKSNFLEIWLSFWQTVRYCRNFEFVARIIRNSRITGNNQFDSAKMVRSPRVVTMCSIHCIHRKLLERVFHFFLTHFVVVKSKKANSWKRNVRSKFKTIAYNYLHLQTIPDYYCRIGYFRITTPWRFSNFHLFGEKPFVNELLFVFLSYWWEEDAYQAHQAKTSTILHFPF